MKKKLMALLLCLAMTATLFAGCGGSGNDGKIKATVFCGFYLGYGGVFCRRGYFWVKRTFLFPFCNLHSSTSCAIMKKKVRKSRAG